MNFYKMSKPAHGLFLRPSVGVGGWFRPPFVFDAYYDRDLYDAGIGQDLDIIKIDGEFVSGLYTQRTHTNYVHLIKDI